VVHGEYLVTAEGLPGGAFFSIENSQITRVTNSDNLRDWLDQVSTPQA